MHLALLDHEGTISIERRAITNVRFADDIDGLAGSESELNNLINKIDVPQEFMAWRLIGDLQWKHKLWQIVKGTSRLIFPDWQRNKRSQHF